MDQLEEGAVLAAGLLLLVKQRQLVAVESVEPLVPANVLQLIFARPTREIEAQHTWRILATGAAYGGWRTVVLLHPLADLVMISRRSSL